MRSPAAWLALLAAVLAPVAHAQIPHESVYDGLAGSAITQAIRSEPVPATRGYGPARDSMYTWEQRTFGRIRCVYTGHEIVIPLGPGFDASTQAYNRGINAEHTWPQSMGAGSEPQQSDLHNLFPTRDAVNSARGNLPFGESPDPLTTHWYRLATTQTSLPTVSLGEWSERQGSTRFEPREDHKGNVARAMLYFYSRWAAASTSFLQPQISDLVAWADADPVDEAEWARMEYIARLQGNRNPFVVDPTLARRAFLPGTVGLDDASTTSSFSVTVFPNPATSTATVRLDGPAGTPVALVIADALGREVWRGEAVRGTVALPVGQWAPGVYVVHTVGAAPVRPVRFTVAR